MEAAAAGAQKRLDGSTRSGGAAGGGQEPAARVRVRCISDIHVDEKENMAWIAALPEHPEDVLIVAGDLSDKLDIAREALRLLRTKYAEVLCVPGNHDLWLDRRGDTCFNDSLEKLAAFQAMCHDEGVRTGPLRVGPSSGGRACCVVPLLSWHHQSFDTEPDVVGWGGIIKIEHCMTDFKRCRWPPPLSDLDDSVARAVDALNDQGASLPDGAGGARLPIISFSHFLPRIELNPEKRFLFLPNLSKASGSLFLRERVERLRSSMHVFGHTHFAWDAELDGTRYVQAALGYPHEWEQRAVSLAIGALPQDLVVLWDSVDGFVPPMPARWSGYYERQRRRPELNHLLAPYVAPMYEQLPGGEVCDWPMGKPRAAAAAAGAGAGAGAGAAGGGRPEGEEREGTGR